MVNNKIVIYNALIDIDSRFVTKSVLDEFPVYGDGGLLDSLDLVRLVVTLEDRFSKREERPISLSSEKAMSYKNNPYRTFNTLVEFVEECLKQ